MQREIDVEGVPELAGFHVMSSTSPWAEYGIYEYIGSFGPERTYKVVRIRNTYVVKSPRFIPIPNTVVEEIFETVKRTHNLQEGRISKTNDPKGKFYGTLISKEVKGTVDVGDIVAWGLSFQNDPIGSFKIESYLMRLACSNGMTVPEESEATQLAKTYNIEELKSGVLDYVEMKRETFESKLEYLRVFKRYKLNAELAQLLARKFPRPIIEPAINVRYEKRVPIVVGFREQDLWKTYNDITYNISHRPLKLSTQLQWTSELTGTLQRWIEKNAGTEPEAEQ